MAKRRKQPVKTIGECHLCGETKRLCNAHLFPNGLRKFVGESATDPSFYVVNVETGEGRQHHTLFYDPAILCADCDGKLGKFDSTLIDFVQRWNDHPSRDRQITTQGYDPVAIQVDTAKLRQAVLICIYRFAISTRYPKFSVHPFLLAILTRIVIEGGARPDDPFHVAIIGYSKHVVSTGNGTIDVSQIGRPHPAMSDRAYFMELFGLSIFVQLERDPRAGPDHYVGEPDGRPDSATVHITSVRFGTPSFTHCLNIIEAGAARSPSQSIRPADAEPQTRS